jgi:nicotinamide riboside kinase
MKIAMCGSFCTGKTTISKLIAEKSGLSHIPDLARIAVSNGWKIDSGSSVETETYLLGQAIEQEYQNQSFITETPLLNIYVYSKLFIQSDALVNLTKELITSNRYDYVLYCPVEFDIINDGLRETSLNTQILIDIEFQRMFEEFNIKPIKLTGSIKNRLKIWRESENC